jgi:hypothetical protein
MDTFTTSLQAVHYLLKVTGVKNRLSIVKLIFLADKRHFLLTGRLVTESDYFSMQAGPVSSQVLDILEVIAGRRREHNQCDVDTSAVGFNGKGYQVVKPMEYDMLSVTDREAIEYIAKEFGGMTDEELIGYTHIFPEWAKDKEFFARNKRSRKPLSRSDLLSVVDERLGVTEDDLLTIKEILYC